MHFSSKSINLNIQSVGKGVSHFDILVMSVLQPYILLLKKYHLNATCEGQYFWKSIYMQPKGRNSFLSLS
jgi:hypothetical protein